MILNNCRTWLAASLAVFGLSLFWACKTDEKLPPLGDAIAGPIDVASSPSGKYFYVLNSDYERKYNQGSLMVIDPNDPAGPQKLQSIPTQRLGRSLDVAQNLLLITYDSVDSGNPQRVEIWDLQDEKNPSRVVSWTIDCTPLNGVLAPTRAYFAVTCLGGQLYMGHLNKTNLGSSTLDSVRAYGYARRALYFYEGATSTKLLAFPTDIDTPGASDFAATDLKSYNIAANAVLDGANEVPDSFENTLEARRQPGAGYPYQMVIYDVTAEEQASPSDPTIESRYFRSIELGTFLKPTQANSEMRYISFSLQDLDGGLASGEQTTDITTRNYRTNFWTIRPSLDGRADTFYISQRGNAYGSPSNNIIKVTINPTALNAASSSSFAEMFSVERVYGFSNDRDSGGRFPGAFALAEVGGEPMLIMNHFRDLINFRSAPFYSISRKFLSQPLAGEQASSYDSISFESSFYQVAVAKSGKVLTGSYYGRSLYLFDASPRLNMSSQTPIRIE